MSSDSSGSTSASASSSASTVGDGAPSARSLVDDVTRDRTSEGGAISKTVSTVPGDTCTWYSNGQCSEARSCFDCLNTRLPGQACMIDPYGACVGMDKYSADMDFRRALPMNVVQVSANVFPSSNTTYCATGDPYCALCRQTWNNPFESNSELSFLSFCRGTGGCVCVRSCESAYHNDNVIAQRCVAYGYSRPSVRTIYMSIAIMTGLCFVFALATVVVRRWVNRNDRRGNQMFRHDQPLAQREPSGPRLALSGWHSMREKLIQSERAQLQGVNDQTLTVPVIDNTLGPAVVVESDVYLPASPSDLARHTHNHDELQQMPVLELPQQTQPAHPRTRSVSDPTSGSSTRPVSSSVSEVV